MVPRKSVPTANVPVRSVSFMQALANVAPAKVLPASREFDRSAAVIQAPLKSAPRISASTKFELPNQHLQKIVSFALELPRSMFHKLA